MLLPGQRILGGGATLVPLAAMGAMFDMGPSSSIDGLQLQNSEGLAQTAIRIPGDADSVAHVTSATIIGFSTGIRAESGAYDVESSFFLNNGTALAASEAAANGTVASNYVLGGSGFDLGSDADQAYSTEVVSNVVLPAVPGAYGIRVTAGASVRIERNVVDQIISGPGVIIDGDNGLIGTVSVTNNYLGANLYATEATNGIQLSGPLAHANIAFNTFAGWGGYDLSAAGTSGLVVTGNNLSSTAGMANVKLASVQDAILLGNQFESRTASLVEDASTNSASIGNTFASGPDYAASSAHSGNRGDLVADTGMATVALQDAFASVAQSTVPATMRAPSGTGATAMLGSSAFTEAELSAQADSAGVINAALARLSPGDTLILPAGTFGIAAPIQLNGRN
ncbi:MAG: hypothetical protein JOZ05_07675, partial [Acetobacteraceae bacterium]|nr:hypothetical protein [Acetobacteraceae bacterium]